MEKSLTKCVTFILNDINLEKQNCISRKLMNCSNYSCKSYILINFRLNSKENWCTLVRCGTGSNFRRPVV